MAERILVTGGAGFIGRWLVRLLLSNGYEVRVLDALLEQVHGDSTRDLILDHTDFIHGDVRDAETVARALVGVDRVVHLAAEVGVGQSMYAIDRYVSVNDHGSAVLFQALIDRPVARVVVASSMSIYGEGLYRTTDGRYMDNVVRRGTRDPAGRWDPRGPEGEPLVPLPTPESKRSSLASVYALTKYVQEQLTLTVTQAYGMEGVALRLFNVFGPGQALSNPYTGVLAIFASRLLNGEAPVVFEDGEQRRDFVHAEDVARAFLLALERPGIGGGIYNIASGQNRSILEIAQALAEAMGRPEIVAEPSGKGRAGDIRHCFADISRARAELGFDPQHDFAASLGPMVDWVRRQRAVDRVAEARRELEVRGLVA